MNTVVSGIYIFIELGEMPVTSQKVLAPNVIPANVDRCPGQANETGIFRSSFRRKPESRKCEKGLDSGFRRNDRKRGGMTENPEP